MTALPLSLDSCSSLTKKKKEITAGRRDMVGIKSGNGYEFTLKVQCVIDVGAVIRQVDASLL